MNKDEIERLVGKINEDCTSIRRRVAVLSVAVFIICIVVAFILVKIP